MPLIMLSAPMDSNYYKSYGATAEQIGELENERRKMRECVVALSQRGAQCMVPDTGHFIQLDRPNVVIWAIEQAMQLSHGDAMPSCAWAIGNQLHTSPRRPALPQDRSRSVKVNMIDVGEKAVTRDTLPQLDNRPDLAQMPHGIVRRSLRKGKVVRRPERPARLQPHRKRAQHLDHAPQMRHGSVGPARQPFQVPSLWQKAHRFRSARSPQRPWSSKRGRTRSTQERRRRMRRIERRLTHRTIYDRASVSLARSQADPSRPWCSGRRGGNTIDREQQRYREET